MALARHTARPKMALPAALGPAARLKVEKAIEAHMAAQEALIAFLDGADGNYDEEDGGDDEPSLGAVGGTYNAELQPGIYYHGNGGRLCGGAGGGDDREADVQDEPHDPDPAEPSLGSFECVGYIPADAPGGRGFDQRRWALGDTFHCDLEDEHDGREPDDERWFVPAVG